MVLVLPRKSEVVPVLDYLIKVRGLPFTEAVERIAGREIDRKLIDYCIHTGRLYESRPYHNEVFVGMDRYEKPRYAGLRGVKSESREK